MLTSKAMRDDHCGGKEVFAIPIDDRVLVYAPLHDLTALVNRAAAGQLRLSLAEGREPAHAALAALSGALQPPGIPVPRPREGGLGAPLFLGLVTTRGCNMSCRYCDFVAGENHRAFMDIATARDAVDAYLNLLVERGMPHAELHLFGGEPFLAARTVHFAVEYAIAKAAEKGLSIHLEAITNGLFDERMARWVASTFGTVFLSLDGPPDIQDRYRPARSGRGVFDVVARNARIFAEQNVELILRSCVTAETVARMPETAAWFAAEFQPASVCFETLVPSALSRANRLEPPDPWVFAQRFGEASEILAARGIDAVLSTACIDYPHATFCPVGSDAIIVTPDARVHACYLLEEDWQREGLDLTYGRVSGAGLELDDDSLRRVRELNLHNYPLCADCFCRFHCSGGCHVNRVSVLAGGEYDATCIQTRLVSASILLRRLGQDDLARRWLASADIHRPAVLRRGDRL